MYNSLSLLTTGVNNDQGQDDGDGRVHDNSGTRPAVRCVGRRGRQAAGCEDLMDDPGP